MTARLVWWLITRSLTLLKAVVRGRTRKSGDARGTTGDSVVLPLWLVTVQTWIHVDLNACPHLYELPEPAVTFMRGARILFAPSVIASGIGWWAWQKRFWNLVDGLHYLPMAVCFNVIWADLYHCTLLFQPPHTIAHRPPTRRNDHTHSNVDLPRTGALQMTLNASTANA